MKICFVLPKYSRQPIGGFKIVFEYANRLCMDGNQVSLLFLNQYIFSGRKMPARLKKMAAHFLTQHEPTWFPLNPKIKKYSFLDRPLKDEVIHCDWVIATSASTVDIVQKYFSCSKKAYMIQDYESWDQTEEYLHETYAMGMKNIAVASWLKNIVDQYAQYPSTLIRNPVDINIYRPKIDIHQRNPYKIGMLYHRAEQKGCKYAIEAVKIARKKHPEITLQMFGAYIPDFRLPEWVTFTHNASQDETIRIYNSCSIFVCATIQEGFGLTGLEAMSCGDAFISTNYLGVREYAVNGENALLSPVKDTSKMAENICRVIEDDDLRFKLAENAIKSAESMSWEQAYETFKQTLKL